uniref:HD domain-containing protein n=1 Tax=Magallana gigas TaxID=29159 RepID=A0A8W8MK04_MAGGI
MSEKVFNDPIHGHIRIHPLCVKIIDTPQFQRLRSIKQLGGTYFVYPGAAHNRFEHSLGVCYLAGKVTSTLRERQHDLGITENDVLCVQIAGLCHDLGQGPFSRMFENKFLPMVRETITHEKLSLLMFNRLVHANGLIAEFTKYKLDEKDMTFIREQIAGPSKTENREWPYEGRTKEKGFLYEIVANKRNGIDVDKWDYFERDCKMLGINNSFNHRRCMENIRVLQINTVGSQLCFAEKECGNLCDMFKTRYELHEKAYKHRVGDCIETMIAEAMLNANDIIKISGKDGKKLKISDTIEDMEAYEKLTDSIFEKILHSKKSGLEKSKEILRRVQTRNLYKFVGLKDPKQPIKTDFELKWVSLDCGMKDENPLNHVYFYNTDGIPFKYNREEVSSLLPSSKKELRVLCKREDKKSQEDAEKAMDKLMLQ